jgi:predicted nuclease with RNAse H fold
MNRTKVFIGWDVGGWHCDRNTKSRDALIALTLSAEGLIPIGRPWRGNLRTILTGHCGDALIDAMLECCDIKPTPARDIVVAIDTPLGWPQGMLDLAMGGPAIFVSGSDGENPYTRRATELALIRRGFAPLSAVRDMLGSQSTKGIHFLRAADLSMIACGVWEAKRHHITTAIESYPAVALALGRTREIYDHVFRGWSETGLIVSDRPLSDDVRDALICATVAYLFGQFPAEIEAVPRGAPVREGWIILPRES